MRGSVYAFQPVALMLSRRVGHFLPKLHDAVASQLRLHWWAAHVFYINGGCVIFQHRSSPSNGHSSAGCAGISDGARSASYAA